MNLPAEPVVIETDVTKVRQTLLNLLTNAGKFTARGTVTCRLRDDRDTVAIEVADTGPRHRDGRAAACIRGVLAGSGAARERSERTLAQGRAFRLVVPRRA